MIKMIASDLDGTLLPEATSDINPKIYELIRQIQEKGVTFVVASGRNYESVMSIFGKIEKELTVISDNGGHIARDGQTLHCVGFPKELLKEIVWMARQLPDVWMMASAARGVYTDMNDSQYIKWIREGYHQELTIVDDLLTVDEPIIKVAIHTGTKDAKEVADPLMKRIGERVSVAVSGERWVDFMMPGVNKGVAVAYLQQTMGIAKEETIAFGDNGNDITMLMQAEESYAVANARPEVKQVTKYVIGDVSQAAVLSELERICCKLNG